MGPENGKIISKEIEYSPGLYKIYDEIISNAYDEAIRSKNVKNIYVEINNNEISIMNDGSAVEVKKHSEYNTYIPQLIFGEIHLASV